MERDGTMSETDKLRALLDGRGVEYETDDMMGACVTSWNGFSAFQLSKGARLTMALTAQQAVDATLGREVTPMLVSDDLGHVLITLGGIKTWDVTEDAAALGRGECEPKWLLQGETQTQEFWRCECGHCGHEFGVEDRSSFPFKMTIDEVKVPNFCPECGWRMKR